MGPRAGAPGRSDTGGASRPRISVSPEIDSGLWNTSPGGCTVIVVIWGRRLRCKYADVIESSTGDVPSLPTSAAFTWRKRARSLAMGSPPARTCGGDQSDQVESG